MNLMGFLGPFNIRPEMWQVQYILGWNHTPGVFWWRVQLSKQKSSAVFDTSCLKNGIIFDPSLALLLTWQSSSPWDCGTTYPKDQFFYLSVIFYIKDCNSVDQSRNCRCERQRPPHYWNLWSSVTVPEAELISVLRSAPELEIWTHNTPGWIPALSSPWLFTLTGYETLQDLSPNAKLISYLGSTVSSSCRHNTISEARVKFLKKSTVTTTMTE